MTIVLVHPDWQATTELAAKLTKLLGYGGGYALFHSNIEMVQSKAGDDVVHQLNGIPQTLPSVFGETVPVRKLTIINANSAVTNAPDGEYRDGQYLWARVETYVHHGVLQQYIRVEGDVPPDSDLDEFFQEMKGFYDALRAGHHRSQEPVHIPAQPEAAKAAMQ